jgi:SAM-dependent methyltransferase
MTPLAREAGILTTAREPGALMCRFCDAPLSLSFADLGMSPLCQRHIKPSQLNDPETFYPLHAFVCTSCWLVQLGEYASPDEIFAHDYPYFSSYSDTWLQHARDYSRTMMRRLELGSDSLVVEVASNDGYLLRNFVEANIPVLGIEPADNCAAEAEKLGVRTVVKFFGSGSARWLAQRYGQADLLIGNNVLAHVPALNDFVRGMALMLKPAGILTLEFPHLVRLVDQHEFDTVYHEHFSYFSFTTVERLFAAHAITLFDVEELPTHGGSLRIYGCQRAYGLPASPRVSDLKRREETWGVRRPETYRAFDEKVKESKRAILEFFIGAKRAGKAVVGYGAPGKGNTLLNYCGIRADLMDYTVDRSPHKQNTYTPGTHIPVYAPSRIRQTRPDYVFILPWNLKDEIMDQLSFIREWGGRFVVPIPEVKVYE